VTAVAAYVKPARYGRCHAVHTYVAVAAAAVALLEAGGLGLVVGL